MVNIINPKVTIIDYGPKLVLQDGTTITPDELVYGASRITYKDTGVLSEMIELKKSGKDLRSDVKKSLIKSAGSGHASMATTPGLWLYLEGNSSKMVDSIFTGARFSSSLMPSGRRVPVTKQQILIPSEIREKGFEDLYMKVSEANIGLYEELQTKGVPKEEAAKIVQYGHKGGGFAFMPLETIICVARNINENGSLIPGEAKEILSQLEEFIYKNGMGVVYDARKNAPRTGCPNPNIFHNRVNLAEQLITENYQDVLNKGPQILFNQDIFYPCNKGTQRIASYLKKRNKSFSSLEDVEKNNAELLRELELVIEDYNDSLNIKTISNSPWRVWGEVKRHRTLGQTTESVYNAIEKRARQELLNRAPDFNKVMSMPPEILNNPELYDKWTEAFSNSIKAYSIMINSGINPRDAIMVVPRGLKLGILKSYDLYNLTTGYMSLRLCNTAEPEMRRTTEQEKELFKNILPGEINKLITPKCFYVGFCPDKYCGKVNSVSNFYNKDIHAKMQKSREESILREIDSNEDLYCIE